MKTFIFAAVLFSSGVSLAQTRTPQVFVGTVCNAVTHAAPRNCEIRNVPSGVYGVAGFNLLTLQILQDQDADGGAGATGYTFYLQACSEGLTETDCTTDSDWYTIQGESYASGTLTLADGLISKTVAASADSQSMWSVAINYVRLRLYAITALTQTEAADTFTVKAWLANSPAF